VLASVSSSTKDPSLYFWWTPSQWGRARHSTLCSLNRRYPCHAQMVV